MPLRVLEGFYRGLGLGSRDLLSRGIPGMWRSARFYGRERGSSLAARDLSQQKAGSGLNDGSLRVSPGF